jgi:hypothetical protein
MGTYLRVQGQTKTRLEAADGKRFANSSRQAGLDGFHRVLDRVAEKDLDRWHREMAVLVHDISKDEGLTKEDKVRKKASEIIDKVCEILEKSHESATQLQRLLQTPVEPILRIPVSPAAGGIDLAVLIAVLHVLQALVRIRLRPR